jgi:hypothetical protein
VQHFANVAGDRFYKLVEGASALTPVEHKSFTLPHMPAMGEHQHTHGGQ